MLNNGVIFNSLSLLERRSVLIAMKDGTTRFCIDGQNLMDVYPQS